MYALVRQQMQMAAGDDETSTYVTDQHHAEEVIGLH
jgi:hypothetical protein